MYVYAEAYREAARTLTRSLLRRRAPSMSRDGGIIPILFLWRHYLEITLKALIADMRAYKGQEPLDLTNEHDLSVLWDKVGLQELLSQDQMGQVEHAIASFSRADPKSQAFRYSATKKGARSAPGLEATDIRLLNRAMTTVSGLLETARWGIDGLLHQRREDDLNTKWRA